MRVVYNILFFFFFWLSAPFYFWKLWRRGNWQKGFAQRFGNHTGTLKYSLTNRHVIWVHAVSVGEANVCAQLIRELEPRLPLSKFVVSTTTTTGMGELQKKLPAHVEKIYYPVDFPRAVRRAIAAVHPAAVILVEAEIWPNFLWQLRNWKVPVFLINARLSERSYPRYRNLGFLFRPLFGMFDVVGAQNNPDVTRLKNVGCRGEAIHLTGNLKFDATHWTSKNALDVPALLRQLGVPEDAPVIVAGSTHNGEEVMLARQCLRLKSRFKNLFLVIVPRHMERAKSLQEELRRTGLKFALRSKINSETNHAPGELDALLVNSTGELMYFYERATVAFVGKSITAKGGQNPIEPALLGKATVFGPNMQNFRSIVEAFLEDKAVVQVRNADELEQAFAELLADEQRRTDLGRRARAVVVKNQGATLRTADLLVEELKKTIV